MEALVLKCKEIVNNPNLRGLDELRLKIHRNQNGDGGIIISNIHDGGSVLPEWKIISGNGYFTNGSWTANYGTELKGDSAIDTARLMVTSDIVVVSITNFAKCCNKLGSGISTDTVFINGKSPYPYGEIELSELKGHATIGSINAMTSTIISGDLKNLKGLTSLTTVNGNNSNNDNAVVGNIKYLPDSITRLNVIKENTNTLKANSVVWSLATLTTKANLNYVVLNLMETDGGGDLYSFLKSKTGDLYADLSRGNRTGNKPTITCSYASGNTLPVVNIQKLNLFQTGAMDKTNVIKFLNLLKDGLTASNKITMEASTVVSIACASGVASDSDVTTLKATVDALLPSGATLTLI